MELEMPRWQMESIIDAVEDASLNNGPEDLFLEELINNLRKIPRPAGHRSLSPSLPSLALERLLNGGVGSVPSAKMMNAEALERPVEEPEAIPIRISSGQQQHPFAYRPSQIQFFDPDAVETEPVKPKLFQPVNTIVLAIEAANPTEAPTTAPTADRHQSITDDESDEPKAHAVISRPGHSVSHHRHYDSFYDIYFTALVAGCTAVAVAAMLGFGVCFYRWQRGTKAAQEVEYPAYGITGPGPSPGSASLSLKTSPSSSSTTGSWLKSPKMPSSMAAMAATGDKKLAHSAHMFHFQHQKQQVIAMESNSSCDRRGSNSGGESDEDNEEGDYTVYECPGLAPTGEMEVKNPLFLDDPTPASPAANKLVKRPSE
nr:EOG090X0B4J [Sida crystallina]